VSIGSSRDGEVEAWEGFADDSSSDEDTPQDDLIGLSIDSTLPPALRNTTTALLDDSLSLHRDSVEEQRVKAALDQSMTGTLSGSRSSSLGGHVTTAQNSIRDLRLSFPDPLTSSRDELHSSYEVPSPFETTTDRDVAVPITEGVVDPGPSIPPSTLSIIVYEAYAPIDADLEIVLYGTSAAMKWSVVDNVIEKAAVGAGIILTPSPRISEQSSCFLRMNGECEAVASFPKVVTVVDRTVDAGISYRPEKHSHSQGSNPSLAIIFLPSTAVVTTRHTSYLPVFVPSNVRSASLDREDAEGWWGRFGLNVMQSALFDIHWGPYSMSDSDALARIEASVVHKAFQRLMSRPEDPVYHTELPHAEVPKRNQPAKDRDNFHFRIGVTGSLLAIVVILFARVYVINTNQLPTPASRTTPSHTVRGRLFPIANKSSSPVPPNNAAVVPSSLKDFALAVFNPVQSSAPFSSAPLPVGRGRPTGGAALDTKKQERTYCKAMSWSERVKSSKDLILTGQSSQSSESRSKKASSLTASKGTIVRDNEPPSSLSIRLVDSLSQILDVKALTEVVRHDMNELSDALDELMIAIGKQTAAIMQESQGSGKILRERLQQRHSKAKARARQLKDMGGQLGGQLMSYVGSEIKSKADQAKSKAREMAETLVNSDAWIAHRKRVLEHRQRIEAGGAEKGKRREIRRARRHARRGNKEGKRERGFLFT
jgi:hypothetical protein